MSFKTRVFSFNTEGNLRSRVRRNYQTGHFLPMYRDSLVSRDVAIFSSSDISSDLMISHDMSYSPLHLHGNVAGNMHSPIVHTIFLVIGIYHDMSRRVTILQDMIYAKVKFYEA